MLESEYGCDCAGCDCSGQPCNLVFVGDNDGLNTEDLGVYQFEALDPNGVPFYRGGGQDAYMYSDGDYWMIGTDPQMTSGLSWYGAFVSSGPQDVVVWFVYNTTGWLEQENMEALESCGELACERGG